MKTFENLLPKVYQYEDVLSKSSKRLGDKFLNEIKIFDQSKWEDRLILLSLIMKKISMKEDPRPGFSAWYKKELVRLGNDLEIDGINTVIVFLQEKMQEKFEISEIEILREHLPSLDRSNRHLMMVFSRIYTTLYPTEMVKTTPLGDFCFNLCNHLKEDPRIKEHIENLILSLCSTIEQIYCDTVNLKSENQSLWLRKGDIEWEKLLDLRWKISLLGDWYKEFCLGDIYRGDLVDLKLCHSEYDNTNAYIIDIILKKLFDVYEVKLGDYTKAHYECCWKWYSPQVISYHETDMEDCDDDIFDEEYRAIHNFWTNTYGEL